LLACLDHLLPGAAAHEAVSGADEFHARQRKVSLYQLVHGRLLVRVLAVPEALLDQFARGLVGKLPRSFLNR
jgi:hypothetical protein